MKKHYIFIITFLLFLAYSCNPLGSNSAVNPSFCVGANCTAITTSTSYTSTKSMHFNGNDEVISLPGLSLPSAFTISSWVKFNAVGVQEAIIGGCRDANSACTGLDYATLNFSKLSSGEIAILYGGPDISTRLVNVKTTSTNLVKYGRWQHIVASIDTTNNTYAIYIDGEEITSLTPAVTGAGAVEESLDTVIGGVWVSFTSAIAASRSLKGGIDELAIWNEKLTQAEVAQIYNNHIPQDLSSLSSFSNIFAWYRLGEGDAVGANNVIDHSGNGYHGTMTAMESTDITENVPLGIYSTESFAFNGTDEYIEIQDTADLDLSGDFTISAWIYAETGQSSSSPRIISKNSTSVDGWGFYSYAGGGRKLGLRINNNVTLISSVGDLEGDGWFHAAVTYEVGVGANFYIDGVLDATIGTYTTASTTNTENIRIGNWVNNGSSRHHKGKIDDVAIWNQKLTDLEIQEIYNGGQPFNLVSHSQYANLAAWWPFTTNDTAGANGVLELVNNYHGTLTNMTIADNLVSYSSAGCNTRLQSCYAMDFDGTNDRVTIDDANSLTFFDGVNDEAFSISAWVNMDDATSFRVIAKELGADREYFLSTNTSDELIFVLYSSNVADDIRIESNQALTSYEGEWVHITASYDGSGLNTGLKFYINGSVLASTPDSNGTFTTMSNTTAPLEVGEFNGTYSDGRIRNLSLWSKELTASEAIELYNNGVVNNETNLSSYISSCVSLWKLGDGDILGVSNTRDSKGANHGRMRSMTSNDVVTDAK